MNCLEIDEYNSSDLIERKNTDNHKYVFEYQYDLCWDSSDTDHDSSFRNGIADLDKYHKEENHEKFIEVYNKLFESKIFKVVSISRMHGPGGGWPDATIRTEPVTIKEFISMYDEGLGYFDSDMYVNVCKVED